MVGYITSRGYYITEMVRDVLTNCIFYMECMTPRLLIAGAIIAAFITAVGGLVGLAAARLMVRLPRPLALVLNALLILLLLPAPTLTGMVLYRAAASYAPLVTVLTRAVPWLRLTTIASAAGACVVSIPILILLAARALRRVDRETVLAAQTLGMSKAQIRRHVILPQARFGITAGMVLCAARAFGESTATAAALGDLATLQESLVAVFAADLLDGTYACVCLWTLVWLLAGGIILLLVHWHIGRRRPVRRVR